MLPYLNCYTLHFNKNLVYVLPLILLAVYAPSRLYKRVCPLRCFFISAL